MLNVLNASRRSLIPSNRRFILTKQALCTTSPTHNTRLHSHCPSFSETDQGPPKPRPSRYVFVNNIPHELTKEELTRHLPKSVRSVILPRVQSATNMFAHLTFETAQAASDALAHHNRWPIVIGTSALRMAYTRSIPPSELEPSSTLFVGHLPMDSSKESIAALIRVPANYVENIVQQDHSTSAMVHYESVEAASFARRRMRFRPPIVDDLPIHVDYAWVVPTPSSNLRYSNYHGPLQGLRDMLGPFQEAFIGIQSDEKRGRGFIIFTHAMAAKEAREKLNKERTAGGHLLKLDFARTQISYVRQSRADVSSISITRTPQAGPVLEEVALEPLPPAGRYLALHRPGVRQYRPLSPTAGDPSKLRCRNKSLVSTPSRDIFRPSKDSSEQLEEQPAPPISSTLQPTPSSFNMAQRQKYKHLR